MTGLHLESGLSNQARIDILMSHLALNGKKRLVSSWDVYPQESGEYEVSYIVSTIAKQAASPSPSPSSAQGSPTPRRAVDPFARPQREKPPADALVLTWTVNPAKSVCQPKDERTRSLLSLPPQLDSGSLEDLLPEKWRAPASAELEAPLPEPTAAPDIPQKKAPQVKPKETPDAPQAKQQEPIKFAGFIGEGKERRAILSRGAEHYSLAPGDRFSGFLVKSFDEDEMVLQRGQDTLRLVPGQAWEPFLSPR